VSGVREGEGQDAAGSQHGMELGDQVAHLDGVRVSEDREGEDDVELHAAIGYRQIADSLRVVLWVVTVEMNEASPGMVAAASFDDGRVDVDAPVILVIDRIAGSDEESADIPPEIQDLAPLPRGATQDFIEVHELVGSFGDRVPHDRSRRFQDGRNAGRPTKVI